MRQIRFIGELQLLDDGDVNQDINFHTQLPDAYRANIATTFRALADLIEGQEPSVGSGARKESA